MPPPVRLERAARALRAWFRPPRRLRVKLGGGILIGGVFVLGLATLNTGNNLLYLLVGALLGMIALSGWLSEQSISGIRVERRIASAVTAGQRARIEYRVHNVKPRLPSVALEIAEARVQLRGERASCHVQPAWLGMLPGGESATAVSWLTLERRGIYRLERMTVGTAYPFGLFIKERDLALGGTLVVWPRTDRIVRAVQVGGRRGARRHAGTGAGAAAERDVFRGLRPYRVGDDPRDVHWRTSARLGEPAVREYERDAGDAYWIVLDLATSGDARLDEAAVEIAAALAARGAARGDRFGMAAGTARIPPSGAGGQLEAALDLLAAAEFRPGAPRLLPAPEAECVLVTAAGTAEGFADVVSARQEEA